MKVNVFRLQVYQGERFKPSLDVKKTERQASSGRALLLLSPHSCCGLIKWIYSAVKSHFVFITPYFFNKHTYFYIKYFLILLLQRSS